MKKATLFFMTSVFCSSAMANFPAEEDQEETPVEHYNYSMKLDIAKVLSHTPISRECGVVPAQMIYLDSTGKKRILEYRELGEGC